jgi:hypothetical protein
MKSLVPNKVVFENKKKNEKQMETSSQIVKSKGGAKYDRRK